MVMMMMIIVNNRNIIVNIKKILFTFQLYPNLKANQATSTLIKEKCY